SRSLSTIGRFFRLVLDVQQSISDAKALSAKFEGSKQVESSATSKFSFPSSRSIKPSVCVEIRDPAAAEDVTMNLPEFIHDSESSEFFKSRSSTLTKERLRCLIFISGLRTKPWLPLRTRLLKIVEENPNVALQEMVRGGVKMANLTRDSDANPTRLVYEKCKSMLQSSKLLPQSNTSNRKPLPFCLCCRGWYLPQHYTFKQYQFKQCRKIGHKEGYYPQVSPSALESSTYNMTKTS
ncbi:unnamed protein product, partial [Hymenolepis diminuta]